VDVVGHLQVRVCCAPHVQQGSTVVDADIYLQGPANLVQLVFQINTSADVKVRPQGPAHYAAHVHLANILPTVLVVSADFALHVLPVQAVNTEIIVMGPPLGHVLLVNRVLEARFEQDV
jgi:hypothetical protein